MKTLFCWLHLSDIHMGHGTTAYGWDQHAVMEQLSADLERNVADEEYFKDGLRRPDAVLITGDLAFSGNDRSKGPAGGDGEYKAMGEWLDNILEKIGLDRNHVYMVPGNHDVQRKVEENDSGIRRLVDSLIHGRDQLDHVLANDGDRRSLLQRMANYVQFATGFPGMRKDTSGDLVDLCWHRDIALDEEPAGGIRLRLVGLNSALVAGRNEDKGKLLLGKQQFVDVVGPRSPDQIIIALSHHPLDWLANCEEVRREMQSRVDIHLCGHVHESRIETFRQGGGRQMATIVAGAVHGDERDKIVGHGYNFGAICVDNSGQLWVRVWPRIWESGRKEFQPDTTWTEHNRFYAEHRLERHLPRSHAAATNRADAIPPVVDAHRTAAPAAAITAVRAEFRASDPRPFSALIDRGHQLGLDGSWSARRDLLLLADRVLTAVGGLLAHVDLPEQLGRWINDDKASDDSISATALTAWARAIRECLGDPGLDIRPPASDRSPLVQLLDMLRPYTERLLRALDGLFTANIDQGVANTGIMDALADEMRRHHARFIGRENLLAAMEARLISGEQRPVLITAPEGYGKSAFIAELVWRAAQRSRILGANAEPARKACPWLPGCLLHFGKKSRDPLAIVRSLVAQANTMLLQTVMLPHEIDSDALAFDASSEFLTHRDKPGYPESFVPGSSARRITASRPYGIESLQAILHRALSRMVEERGRALLVIDALDEISPDGTRFGFLPESLPAGVMLLLTTRPEEGIMEAIRRRFRPHRVKLDGLTDEEVARITCIDDAEWNRRVREQTQGSPLLVRDVLLQVQEIDYQSVDIRMASVSVYRGQVQRWRTSGILETKDIRFQVLKLLAVMEPVMPLGLADVQGYLANRTLACTRLELSELLGPVASQLEGLDVDRLKLTTKGLAEHMLKSELSDRDLRCLIRDIALWLAADEEVEDELLASFLEAWSDAKTIHDKRVRAHASSLIDGLIERHAGNRLFNLYHHWVSSDKLAGDTALPDEALRCLKKAAVLEHPRAMVSLARRLLDGPGVVQDVTEGERWLRAAADKGDPMAMWMLGWRLLDGKALAQDVAEGERWLRAAADKGDPVAMGMLGMHLLDKNGLTYNEEVGLEWLRRAVSCGVHGAYILLGFALYQRGLGMPEPLEAFNEAGSLFLECFRLNQEPHAGIDLAYMVRRGEFSAADAPPLAELLAPGLADNDGFAIMNHALILAAGFQYPVDWDQADALIRSLRGAPDLDRIVSWWRECAARGDAEGELVLGWLGRHGLLEGEEERFIDRLRKAASAGWCLPHWLLEAVQPSTYERAD